MSILTHHSKYYFTRKALNYRHCTFLRSLFTIAFMFFIVYNSKSQNYVSSNSFEEVYLQSNPTLKYKYDSINHIHDYSYNWDFDNDGQNDRLCFIGTGGAHLYFYLQVVLSSDRVVRKFSFIQSDFPALPPDSILLKQTFNPKAVHESFAVFESQKRKVIYIKLDQASFNVERKELKMKGLKSQFVVIYFANGLTIYKDYK